MQSVKDFVKLTGLKKQSVTKSLKKVTLLKTVPNAIVSHSVIIIIRF